MRLGDYGGMDSTHRLIAVSLMGRRLGVSMTWLCAEAQSGRLPHVVAGDTYLFDPATVGRVLWERAQAQQPLQTPALKPLAVSDVGAAKLMSMSKSGWRGLVARGLAPQGFKVGHSRRWLVRELEAWAAAGAPPAHQWHWQGHEFPTAAREQRKWEKTKSIAAKAGSILFNAIVTALINLAILAIWTHIFPGP